MKDKTRDKTSGLTPEYGWNINYIAIKEETPNTVVVLMG